MRGVLEPAAITPADLARPLIAFEQLARPEQLMPAELHPRRHPRDGTVMRPPGRRRRPRRSNRLGGHRDPGPGRQEQRPAPPRHRIPRQPTLPLEPPGMTPSRHLAPPHCTPPRIQRTRPHPSQPSQPLQRSRTRTQHPTHPQAPSTPSTHAREPVLTPAPGPPPPPLTLTQRIAHDYPTITRRGGRVVMRDRASDSQWRRGRRRSRCFPRRCSSQNTSFRSAWPAQPAS